MPKLKPSAVSASADIVQKNITARGAYFGAHTDRDYAKLLSMPVSTYGDYRREPRKWTLDRLIMAAMALKVPLSWLMTDHSGEIKEQVS